MRGLNPLYGNVRISSLFSQLTMLPNAKPQRKPHFPDDLFAESTVDLVLAERSGGTGGSSWPEVGGRNQGWRR